MNRNNKKKRSKNASPPGDDETTAAGAAPPKSETEEGTSQADILTSYGNDCALFIDADDDDAAYADIEIDGHRETHRVESKPFRDWLRSRYFEKSRKSARGESVAQAVETIAARAKFTQPVTRRKVFLRSANVGDRVYLDLCNDAWSVVEVDADGWRIVAKPEVRFRRTKGMLPIAAPTRGGSVMALRPLLNVRTEDDFVLSVGWLLQALRGKPPFVHDVLQGEQGAGKSTYALTLRSIVDPSAAPLRSPPRTEDDLFVAGVQSYVLAFDNLSGVPPWLSDALCRMGDGGGFGKRKHYTNDEEAMLRGGRPMIFNGIDEAITRGDLADRVIFNNLEPIPEEKRLTDEALADALDAVRPSVLGALLDAVSRGLRNLATTKVDRLPRMASFALWGCACEPALCGMELSESVRWEPGRFIAAYRRNRIGAVESVLSADAVACELRAWLTRLGGSWEGTPSELFLALNDYAATQLGNPSKSKTWPASAASLTNAVRRVAPALRRVGVNFEEKKKSGKRRVFFSPVAPSGVGKTSSESSESSKKETTSATVDGLDETDDPKRSLDGGPEGDAPDPEPKRTEKVKL